MLGAMTCKQEQALAPTVKAKHSRSAIELCPCSHSMAPTNWRGSDCNRKLANYSREGCGEGQVQPLGGGVFVTLSHPPTHDSHKAFQVV